MLYLQLNINQNNSPEEEATATYQLGSSPLSLSYPPIRSVHHVLAWPITPCWQLRDSGRPCEIYQSSQSQPARRFLPQSLH